MTIQPVEWSTWLDTIYNGRQFQATVVGVDAANMTARAMLERFTSDYGKKDKAQKAATRRRAANP